MTFALRPALFTVAILAASNGFPIQRPALAAGLDAKAKADLKEATELLKQRRFEEAEKLLVELRLNHPEMASLQRDLGLCYYYLRRPEPALFYLRDYLARKKDHISPEDREDVERWIEDMEALRTQSVTASAAQPMVGPGTPIHPVPESATAAGQMPASTAPPWAATLPPVQYLAPWPYGVSSPPGYPPAYWIPEQARSSFPPMGPAGFAAGSPGADGLAETCDGAHDAPPAFRRGLLAMPYLGWQFPISGVYWISSGFRFGSLLGGHLTEKISLSGELGFATWTWDSRASWDYSAASESRRAAQMDIGINLLRHVALSWGELIVGPKFGGVMMFRHDNQDDLRTFINGLQAGLKLGLLRKMSDTMALGVVTDFSYTINPVRTEADCFYNEQSYDGCTDATSTFLGSLTAAMLF